MNLKLTDEERAEVGELVAELRSRGYEHPKHHGPLVAGLRMRHIGEKYPEAYAEGTGYVLEVLARSEIDIEAVVAYDRPRFEGGSRLTVLADYHIVRVNRFGDDEAE